MTMEQDFFSLKPLVRDRAFLLSLASSVLAVIAAGLGFSVFIISTKIALTPIAEVSLISPPPSTTQAEIRPISEIAEARTNQVVTGWFANLEEVCKLSTGQLKGEWTVILLVPSNGQYKIASSKLNLRTCNLVKKLPEDEMIYAASDTPFKRVSSEQRYMTVDFPK